MTFTHRREWRLSQRKVEAYLYSEDLAGRSISNLGVIRSQQSGRGQERVSGVFIQSHWLFVLGYRGPESSLEGSYINWKTLSTRKIECFVLPTWSGTSPLMWPFEMYEIALSRLQRIQQYSNKNLRKWLGVPPWFSKVGLYTNSGNPRLSISSLEEFKIRKARLNMMMKDSADEVIQKAYSEIKSGQRHHRCHSNQSSWAE